MRSLWMSMALVAMLGVGCTEIRDSGELVRHYFGYVKVISPVAHAPESAVRVLAVETYGLWVSVDRRATQDEATGVGAGLGWRRDRREFIPLDCRVVMRVPDRERVSQLLDALNDEAKERGGVCIIQDSSVASQ